jgi:hypothetical protein
VLGTTAPGSTNHNVLFDPADPPGLPNESEPAQYARHTLLPTPACTAFQGLSRAIVYPDKGGGLYACGALSSHYHPFGTSTEYAPTPLYRIDALGPNDNCTGPLQRRILDDSMTLFVDTPAFAAHLHTPKLVTGP